MKRIFMAVCLMLFAFAVPAADNGLVINLGSRHFVDTDYVYNEKNYGLAYTRYFNDNWLAVQAGFYENSLYHTSLYGMGKIYWTDSGKVRPAFMIGLVTGYNDTPIRPLLAVGVDYEVIQSHKLNLMASPFQTKQGETGVVLGLQYEFLF